jgi:hypothetical protein
MFVEAAHAPSVAPMMEPPIQAIDTTSRVISFVLGFALASLIAWLGSIPGDEVAATGRSEPVAAVGTPVDTEEVRHQVGTAGAGDTACRGVDRREPAGRIEHHAGAGDSDDVTCRSFRSTDHHFESARRLKPTGHRLENSRASHNAIEDAANNAGKRLSRSPGVELEPRGCAGGSERKGRGPDACGTERSARRFARDRRPPGRLLGLVRERPRGRQSAHDGASDAHSHSAERRLDSFGASLDASTAGATASQPLLSRPTDRWVWRGAAESLRPGRARRRPACCSPSPRPRGCGRLAPVTTRAAAG